MNLHSLPIRDTNLLEMVLIPKEYYQKMDIISIPEFEINISIKLDSNKDYVLNVFGDVELILKDAITLEPVPYKFCLNITEKIDFLNEVTGRFIEKTKNSLDIIGILWENIVLEVPISYSTAKLNEESHEGWQVVSEKKKEIDPRLAPLLELFDEEKE